KGVKGEIVTLGQVCDLVANGDKLYAATDRGLFYLDDVEGYIKSKGKSEAWKGWKNLLYGTVVNDVEISGSNLYAGSANGVFESTDGGENWSAVGNIGTAVYSVNANLGSTLLAGTDNGVFSYVNGQTTWNAEGKVEGRVYSIATDPYSDSIYIGSANGFYVSRDGGITFNKVSGDAVVRSISVGYTADPTQGKSAFALYLATETGVMNASLSEMIMNEGVITPPVSTPGAEGTSRPVPTTPNATGNVSQ
ncbi:MAG: hypothetical protein HY877_04290, partial [Deltaproteobacteria bacterium]|nr:hypothetical protein [Deltaproteobacteria bacterium]